MNNKTDLYSQMIKTLEDFNPQSWKDIDAILKRIKKPVATNNTDTIASYTEDIKNGIAFITYDYGIDGVSIEISKYPKICFPDNANTDTMPPATKEASIAILTLSRGSFFCVSEIKTGIVPIKSIRINIGINRDINFCIIIRKPYLLVTSF